MPYRALFIALLLLCPAIPAAAQNDAAAPAQEATCGTCPPGTRLVERAANDIDYKNCTEAYMHQTSEHFEYIVMLMLQNEALFSDEYVTACRARNPGTLGAAHESLHNNRARVADESAAIAPVMNELIRSFVSAFVPRHCRTNRPAQDEAVAQFGDWVAASRAHFKTTALDYAARSRGTLECRHLTSTQIAHIYEIDFRDDPLLGIAAGHAVMHTKQSPELRRNFRAYKAVRDYLRARQSP